MEEDEEEEETKTPTIKSNLLGTLRACCKVAGNGSVTANEASFGVVPCDSVLGTWVVLRKLVSS